MTKLDELVCFILSDKLKEIRNFECYDELVAEAKKLQLEQIEKMDIPSKRCTVMAYDDIECHFDGCKSCDHYR